MNDKQPLSPSLHSHNLAPNPPHIRMHARPQPEMHVPRIQRDDRVPRSTRIFRAPSEFRLVLVTVFVDVFVGVDGVLERGTARAERDGDFALVERHAPFGAARPRLIRPIMDLGQACFARPSRLSAGFLRPAPIENASGPQRGEGIPEGIVEVVPSPPAGLVVELDVDDLVRFLVSRFDDAEHVEC